VLGEDFFSSQHYHQETFRKKKGSHKQIYCSLNRIKTQKRKHITHNKIYKRL
jgi:hypothetical protein